MRSWTPRPPSRGVETRLFGPVAGNPATSETPGRLPVWSWLAPAAGAGALALLLALPEPDAIRRTATGLAPGDLAAPGHPVLTAYAPGWANSAMNNVNGETFESTNWTTAPSPMRTLPVFLTLTNGLIQ